MADDFTPSQDEMQEKFAYVLLIKEAMEKRGWNAAELSRRSGVDEASISRMLKSGMDTRASKLYGMMKRLVCQAFLQGCNLGNTNQNLPRPSIRPR